MCVSTRNWLTRGGRGFLSVEKRTFSRLSRVDAQRPTTDLAGCARAPRPAGRDAGRPDRIGLVFGRRLMAKGLRPTPGRFRTRVLTEGLTPSLRIDYKHTAITQYRKEISATHRDHDQRHPRLREWEKAD
jgi:hypothetical protein